MSALLFLHWVGMLSQLSSRLRLWTYCAGEARRRQDVRSGGQTNRQVRRRCHRRRRPHQPPWCSLAPWVQSAPCSPGSPAPQVQGRHGHSGERLREGDGARLLHARQHGETNRSTSDGLSSSIRDSSNRASNQIRSGSSDCFLSYKLLKSREFSRLMSWRTRAQVDSSDEESTASYEGKSYHVRHLAASPSWALLAHLFLVVLLSVSLFFVVVVYAFLSCLGTLLFSSWLYPSSFSVSFFLPSRRSKSVPQVFGGTGWR